MRLNGWQRIGIVVSVLWVIGGGIWGNEVGISEGDWAVRAYKRCLETKSNDWPQCDRKFEKEYPEAIKYHWANAAIFAFAPIPIGWLAVWGCVALVRWVRRGFTEMPRQK
jgi:hypothetical protein